MRGLRRLLPIVAGVALLASATTGCDWPAGTRYVHPVFTNVDVTSNITYRTTTTYQGVPIDLKLDIYQPRGDTATKRPVMLWMHGGYWIGGNKNDMITYAMDSAKRGYVAVSIQYRLRSSIAEFADAAFDAYDDAAAAAAWLESRAAQYRIDPNAIIAGGYSAGAINALNLAFVPPDRPPATSPVDGAVSVSGFSFRTPRAGRPPVVMFHGSTDTLAPYASGESTCQSSRQQGNHCDFFRYENQGHEIGFTQVTDILPKVHDFVFEKVLLEKGYEPEQLDLAA